MPPKKTSKPRRRNYRKRGYRKSRQGINSSYTAPKNFTETILMQDIVSQPGLSVGNGTAYDMSIIPQNLPNLNGILASMYRQYCVRGVKIMYVPTFNNYPATSGVAFAPRVYWAEDKTAAVPDTSIIDVTRLLTQDNVKAFSAFRTWSTYVRLPKPLLLTNAENDVGGALINTVPFQLPSNKPFWLPLQKQTLLDQEIDSGLSIPHMTGRLSVDGNNSNVAITVGRIYMKVYYSLKEQTISQEIPLPDSTPQV